MPTPSPTRTPILSVSFVMSGLQCTDFNATVFRLALASVMPSATFSDEACTDATMSSISVTSEVSVPLVVVFTYDVVDIHEYVTNVLSQAVSEGTLTAAIVAFANQLGQRRRRRDGHSGLRRLDAGGISAASVESVSVDTFLPSPAPTSTETCFDFVMKDGWGDGWNGAVFTFHDTTTAETVASGTLSSGPQGAGVICLSRSGCYMLSLTSGSYDSEISWSFGGTVSGSAPYHSAEVMWVEEDGALGAGSSCPTPSPTPSPTTATFVPTATSAPSQYSTATQVPTNLSTPSPNATAEVRTYTELQQAISQAAASSTVLVIDLLADIRMTSGLNIESEVTIRSPVGAVLCGGGSTQLIYVEAAGTLVVENTTLRKGYASVRVL